MRSLALSFARIEGRKMPKIIQINGKVTIKREQRLLVVYAERSNFTESKVNPTTYNVKIQNSLSLPMAAFFSFALGIGRKEGKDEVVYYGIFIFYMKLKTKVVDIDKL